MPGFNPRARAGRDAVQAIMALVKYIVSIHAPARGATRDARMRYVHRPRFNPRARAGRDEVGFIDVHIGVVSIHAPARGAT